MKNTFLYKRSHSNIELDINFLSGRVKALIEQDRYKLCRIMDFLFTTIEDVTMLEADDMGTLI